MAKPKEDGGLGFRDFRDFNIALLAKQSWRFLQNPESLVSRVFKAKYYRSSSILQVDVTKLNQISYAFRSILAGRDLIKYGLVWEVGSGNSIRIFEDQWVPRIGSFGLITSKPAGFNTRMCNSLMVEGSRTWNLEALRELLLPVDVQIVSSIPIRPHPLEDRFYWYFSEDGLYSVSSGYKAQVIRSKGEASSSGGFIDRPILSKLWKLKIPKKSIYPVWRLWHGSLAVGSKFRERGMFVDSKCLHCDSEETPEHLFILCPFTQKVWEEDADFSIVLAWRGSIKELIIYVFSSCSTEICEKFVMQIWACWRCRNELRFQSTLRSSKAVNSLSLEHLTWYKEAKCLYGADRYNLGSGSTQWRPPPMGSYTVNADAAWNSASRVMGLGSVIRNGLGEFVAGRTSRRVRVRSPLIAELSAIHLSLVLAAELHLQHIIVQSDSSVGISLLRDGGFGKLSAHKALADMDRIIQDCKRMISSFVSVSFDYINRSGNAVAHLFANKGLVEDDCSYYFQTPVWATDVLSVDLLGLTAQAL